jgi:hypothetical protein
LSNYVGDVCRNSYQLISKNYENQFTQISNEGEKESFDNGYYYHMECYRKVANISKLQKAERNPKNEMQPASESDIESEVYSEPAAKYIILCIPKVS